MMNLEVGFMSLLTAVVSTVFERLPGVEAWFHALDEGLKRRVIGIALLVVVTVVYGGNCILSWTWMAVTCGWPGAIQMMGAVATMAMGSQLWHLFAKRG